MLLIAVGFLVLYKICQPLNQFRGRIILFCAGGIVFSVVFLHTLFSISAISPVSILLLVILFFAADSIFRQYTHYIEKYSRLKNEQKKRTIGEWFKALFSVEIHNEKNE